MFVCRKVSRGGNVLKAVLKLQLKPLAGFLHVKWRSLSVAADKQDAA